eukprot:8046-Pelagococcus_subviridis.AAC.1
MPFDSASDAFKLHPDVASYGTTLRGPVGSVRALRRLRPRGAQSDARETRGRAAADGTREGRGRGRGRGRHGVYGGGGEEARAGGRRGSRGSLGFKVRSIH